MKPPALLFLAVSAGRGASARGVSRPSLSVPQRRSGAVLKADLGEARQRPMRAGGDATSAPNRNAGSGRP